MEQLGGYRQKIYKENQCSPGNDNEGSCLDDKLIKEVAKTLNKLTKKKKITPINIKDPVHVMHENICKKIHDITGCSSEACWMNFKKLMKGLGKHREDFKDSFKPVMPKEWIKDYNEWLKTDDIETCLDQHEYEHDDFFFYGAVPIDFKKCSVSDLCSFNLKKHIQKGHNKIGIVFNTDPHDEPGEHWIAMYVDILGKNLDSIPGIYYFDSYGSKPGKEVNQLIQKIKKQGAKNKTPFKYFYNDHSFQSKDSQCGMYAIHFIKSMLNDISFKKFLNTDLNDKRMKQLRKKHFIQPSKIKYKYDL